MKSSEAYAVLLILAAITAVTIMVVYDHWIVALLLAVLCAAIAA